MIAHVGPTWRSLEAFGESFAPSWAQRLLNAQLRCQKDLENTSENAVFEDFVLGRAGNIPHFGAMWASTWAGVAPKKVSLSQVGQVEALLAKVGPKLAQSWP